MKMNAMVKKITLMSCILILMICISFNAIGSELDAAVFDFVDTDIRDVLRAVSRHTGINIIADSDISGTVTVHLTGKSLDEGLQQLLISHGWFLDTSSDIYRVRAGVRNSDLRIDVNKGLLNIVADGAPLDEIILASATLVDENVLPLVDLPYRIFTHLSGFAFEQVLDNLLLGHGLDWYFSDEMYFIVSTSGKRAAVSDEIVIPVVTIDENGLWVYAPDVPLANLLNEISQKASIDLVVDPNINDVARVFLHGVDLDIALAQLIRIYQLEMDLSDGIISVSKKTSKMNSDDLISISDGKVSINAQQTPLSTIIANIPQDINATIAVQGSDDPPVSIFINDYPLIDAMQVLAQTAGMGLEVRENNFLFSANLPRSFFHESFDLQIDENDKVNIIAQEAPLRLLLGELAAALKINVVVDSSITGDISLVVHGVKGNEAIAALLDLGGLEARETSGGFIEISQGKKSHASPQGIITELPEGINVLQYDQGLMSAELSNVSIGRLIGTLLEMYGHDQSFPSLTVSGNVTGKQISGAISRLPVISGLERLLAPYNLSIHKIGDEYTILSLPEPDLYRVDRHVDGFLSVTSNGAQVNDVLQAIGREMNVSLIIPEGLNFPLYIDLFRVNTEDAVVTILSQYGYTLGNKFSGWEGIIEILPPDTSIIWYGESEGLYSVSASSESLVNVVNELIEKSNLNIVMQPGSYPPVTLELRNLQPDKILGIIANTYQLSLFDRESYLEISPQRNDQTETRRAVGGLGVSGLHEIEMSERNVLIQFENVGLGELLNRIADEGGPVFIPDVSISNQRVSGTISGENARQEISDYLLRENYKLVASPERIFVRGLMGGEPLVHYEDDLFYLDISGGDLTLLIRELANKVSKPIIIYPAVRGVVNDLRVFGVSFETALTYLLSGTTFTFREENGIYLFGEGITPRADSPGFTQSTIIPLKYISPNDFLAILPPSIPSQNVRSVPGDSAIAVFGNENMIASVEEHVRIVDQPYNIETQLVTIKHANSSDIVNILANRYTGGMFHYVQSQNAILLSASADKNNEMLAVIAAMDVPDLGTQTELIPLFHISAEDAKSYMPVNIDSSKVLVYADQNALLASGNPEFLGQIKEYVQTVDIRNPQIIFDVAIVEISGRNNSQFGISGSTEDGTIKFDLFGKSPLSFSFGSGFLADPSITATLRTLVQEGQAKLLANPSLRTLNGREASFNVLTTSRYWVPQSESGSEGSTDVGSSAFRTIETGIRLRLKPWVSASGEITLEIQPEISDSAGASSSSSLPSTNDRSVQTTVRVKDGETIVIGGLIQRSEQREVDKIPFLGDLPVLGKLFSSETSSEIETEFVIAITSHLIDFIPNYSYWE